jgi:hypothetical protein
VVTGRTLSWRSLGSISELPDDIQRKRTSQALQHLIRRRICGYGFKSAAPGVGESTEYLFADDVYEDAEIKGYRDGCARIALGLQDPFHKFFY